MGMDRVRRKQHGELSTKLAGPPLLGSFLLGKLGEAWFECSGSLVMRRVSTETCSLVRPVHQ